MNDSYNSVIVCIFKIIEKFRFFDENVGSCELEMVIANRF